MLPALAPALCRVVQRSRSEKRFSLTSAVRSFRLRLHLAPACSGFVSRAKKQQFGTMWNIPSIQFHQQRTIHFGRIKSCSLAAAPESVFASAGSRMWVSCRQIGVCIVRMLQQALPERERAVLRPCGWGLLSCHPQGRGLTDRTAVLYTLHWPQRKWCLLAPC